MVCLLLSSAPAGAAVCGRWCGCSLVGGRCGDLGARSAAGGASRASSSRRRMVPSTTSSPTCTRMPPMTAGSTTTLQVDRLAGVVAGQGRGAAGAAAPRRAAAAEVTMAVSCVASRRREPEVAVAAPGRSRRPRGDADGLLAPAARSRGWPCPRAGRRRGSPCSRASVRRSVSASRRSGLPATIRSKRKSSSSTWSCAVSRSAAATTDATASDSRVSERSRSAAQRWPARLLRDDDRLGAHLPPNSRSTRPALSAPSRDGSVTARRSAMRCRRGRR